MKYLFMIIALFFLYTGANAQDSTKTVHRYQHRVKFMDKNGDGINDNAPDHDGDGIPNCLDKDFDHKAKMQKKNKKGTK